MFYCSLCFGGSKRERQKEMQVPENSNEVQGKRLTTCRVKSAIEEPWARKDGREEGGFTPLKLKKMLFSEAFCVVFQSRFPSVLRSTVYSIRCKQCKGIWFTVWNSGTGHRSINGFYSSLTVTQVPLQRGLKRQYNILILKLNRSIYTRDK